jgi:hypothetical protein
MTFPTPSITIIPFINTTPLNTCSSFHQTSCAGNPCDSTANGDQDQRNHILSPRDHDVIVYFNARSIKNKFEKLLEIKGNFLHANSLLFDKIANEIAQITLDGNFENIPFCLYAFDAPRICNITIKINNINDRRRNNLF